MAALFVRLKKVTKQNTGDGFSYSVEYLVKLEAGTGGIDAAQTAFDPDTGLHLPNYGDAYAAAGETNVYARCHALNGEQLVGEDRNCYRFTAEFATFGRGIRGAKPNPPADPTQPWTKRAEFGFEEVDYTVAAEEGRQGGPSAPFEAVRNVAGQRYDPGPEKTYSNTIIRVTWWSQFVSLAKLDDYRNKLNDAVFWGYAARRLRINSLTAREVFEYNQYFGQYDAEIEVNCNSLTSGLWYRRVLEEGSQVRKAPGGALVLPADDNGVEHTSPVLLASDGTQLPASGTPVFTHWYVDEDADFSAIGLPAMPSTVIA